MATTTGAVFPTLPTITLPSAATATTAYTPTYDPNSSIGQIIAQLGQYLQPAAPNQTYDAYAAPQRAVLQNWATNTYRPEFERFTLNPFNQAAANNSAATNMNMMGSGAGQYRTNMLKQEQGYQNNLGTATSNWEQMIRDAYNQQLADIGKSATSTTKI